MWDERPKGLWADCDHEWGGIGPEHHPGQVNQTLSGHSTGVAEAQTAGSGQFCIHCQAWRGSLGLEPTPELYIDHLVQVFRGVWRVLRKDGLVWINLGSSYATAGTPGYKAKDLIDIPHLVVEALRKDGWYYRRDIPWLKRAAMPDSATDRPASALEYVFLLTKSAKYYFDMDAIKAKPADYNRKGGSAPYTANGSTTHGIGSESLHQMSEGGRNFRNTDLFYESLKPPHGMIFSGDELVGIDCNPQAFSEAHFATFSEKLITPMILAGTSERGCCPECQAPWVRVVEKSGGTIGKSWHPHTDDNGKGMSTYSGLSGGVGNAKTENGRLYESKTTGWKPGCPHYDDRYRDEFQKARSKRKRYQRDFSGNWWMRVKKQPGKTHWATNPCTTMDPFFGSGTSGKVSEKYGRKWIGIELSEEYAIMAKIRIDNYVNNIDFNSKMKTEENPDRVDPLFDAYDN